MKHEGSDQLRRRYLHVPLCYVLPEAYCGHLERVVVKLDACNEEPTGQRTGIATGSR